MLRFPTDVEGVSQLSWPSSQCLWWLYMQLSSLSASGSFVFFQKLGCRLRFVIFAFTFKRMQV